MSNVPKKYSFFISLLTCIGLIFSLYSFTPKPSVHSCCQTVEQQTTPSKPKEEKKGCCDTEQNNCTKPSCCDGFVVISPINIQAHQTFETHFSEIPSEQTNIIFVPNLFKADYLDHIWRPPQLI